MTAAIKFQMEVSDSPISGSLMWLKKEPSAVNMSVPANRVSLIACEQTDALMQKTGDACIGASKLSRVDHPLMQHALYLECCCMLNDTINHKLDLGGHSSSRMSIS